tara:strand:- start:234 stop:545 length:312 start_codon:yes stop_codon:yes gene_type:complete
MIKVKELKDDALINVKVNKSYYLMAKDLLFYLHSQMDEDEKEKEKSLVRIMEGEYKDLNHLERSFYTATLLLAEIESQAEKNKLFNEKELPEEGEEGYVPPTE